MLYPHVVLDFYQNVAYSRSTHPMTQERFEISIPQGEQEPHIVLTDLTSETLHDLRVEFNTLLNVGLATYPPEEQSEINDMYLGNPGQADSMSIRHFWEIWQEDLREHPGKISVFSRQVGSDMTVFRFQNDQTPQAPFVLISEKTSTRYIAPKPDAPSGSSAYRVHMINMIPVLQDEQGNSELYPGFCFTLKLRPPAGPLLNQINATTDLSTFVNDHRDDFLPDDSKRIFLVHTNRIVPKTESQTVSRIADLKQEMLEGQEFRLRIASYAKLLKITQEVQASIPTQ